VRLVWMASMNAMRDPSGTATARIERVHEV